MSDGDDIYLPKYGFGISSRDLMSHADVDDHHLFCWRYPLHRLRLIQIGYVNGFPTGLYPIMYVS